MSTDKNLILGIDSSDLNCSVAVSYGTKILSYIESFGSSRHSELLMLSIEEALAEANISYNDIEYLAVSNGPGSFTGIRVGLAAARAIILATNNAVKGLSISNFELHYFRARPQIKDFDEILVILNGYKDIFFIQSFFSSNHISTPQKIGLDNLKKRISLSKRNFKLICTGNAIVKIYSTLKQIQGVTILPRFPYIKAIHVCRYAQTKVNENRLSKVEPFYMP